jgi:hypothetical protein
MSHKLNELILRVNDFLVVDQELRKVDHLEDDNSDCPVTHCPIKMRRMHSRPHIDTIHLHKTGGF